MIARQCDGSPPSFIGTYQDLSLEYRLNLGKSADWLPAPAITGWMGISRQESGAVANFTVWAFESLAPGDPFTSRRMEHLCVILHSDRRVQAPTSLGVLDDPASANSSTIAKY